jgi:hypothetical protein
MLARLYLYSLWKVQHLIRVSLGDFVLGLSDCDEEKKQERPLGSIPRGHNRQAFTEVATPIADWPIAPRNLSNFTITEYCHKCQYGLETVLLTIY